MMSRPERFCARKLKGPSVTGAWGVASAPGTFAWAACALIACLCVGLCAPGRALATSPGANGLVAGCDLSGTSPVIWVANPDFSGVRKLGLRGCDPHWSPDSSMIAYVDPQNLYVARADGSNAVAIASIGAPGVVFPFHQGIAWSPDGGRIAFRWARSAEPVDSEEL